MKTTSKLLRRIHALSPLTWAMGMMVITALLAAPAAAQYPPLSEYLMPRDAEIALARSAAPANISGRATIKVLTKSGYEVAHKGDNAFVCMVMRGWAAPTYTPAHFRNLGHYPSVRASICFDPCASRLAVTYDS